MITVSPTLKGRKIIKITPAAKLESEPCNAKPIAKPAAPITATIEAVWTHNWPRTATKVIIIMA